MAGADQDRGVAASAGAQSSADARRRPLDGVGDAHRGRSKPAGSWSGCCRAHRPWLTAGTCWPTPSAPGWLSRCASESFPRTNGSPTSRRCGAPSRFGADGSLIRADPAGMRRERHAISRSGGVRQRARRRLHCQGVRARARLEHASAVGEAASKEELRRGAAHAAVGARRQWRVP
jgi:hypothetical protein